MTEESQTGNWETVSSSSVLVKKKTTWVTWASHSQPQKGGNDKPSPKHCQENYGTNLGSFH